MPRIRPPEAPSGWPIAIAPPLALTISGSILSSASTQASDCTANASLSSTAATSAQAIPARASARSAASTGAKPKSCGSSACAPRPAIRASGSSPIAAAAASEPSSSADAPSLSGEALPAVIVPSGRNDGLSPASFSARRAGPDALVAGQVDARTGTTRSS